MMDGVLLREPFPQHVMACVRTASVEYKVPQLAYLAILKVEGGKSGMKKKNFGVGDSYKYDYSYAQVNSSNIKMVANKLGLDYTQVELPARYNDCYNIYLGAYIFRAAINDSQGDLWRGIGAYHTGAHIKTRRQINNAYGYQVQVYRSMVDIRTNYRWW